MLLEKLSGRVPPADLTLWHRWFCFIPVLTLDGTLTSNVWRRKRNGRWEYQARDETTAEWLDRQW